MKSALLAMLVMLSVPGLVMAVDMADYRREVDIYRTNYATYEVKRGAYGLSPTYALEEELIASARDMLLSRADVWLSYWQLLDEKVNNLPQMSKQNKDRIRGNLTAERQGLGDHKNRLIAATTRAKLLVEAVTVNELLEKYQTLSFSVNSEMAVSKMLQAAESILTFNQNLVDRVNQQQLTENEKASKLRGLTVSAERVNLIVTKLNTAQAKLIESADYASDESFSKITQEIGPLYPELSQQLQTTIELSKGVEW